MWHYRIFIHNNCLMVFIIFLPPFLKNIAIYIFSNFIYLYIPKTVHTFLDKISWADVFPYWTFSQ